MTTKPEAGHFYTVTVRDHETKGYEAATAILWEVIAVNDTHALIRDVMSPPRKVGGGYMMSSWGGLVSTIEPRTETREPILVPLDAFNWSPADEMAAALACESIESPVAKKLLARRQERFSVAS